MRTCDVAIVGAGILGLATAREVLRRDPRLRLMVLEKEREVAQHQTGHNSGVIHSGIFYTPGTLKGRLAGQAGREVYAYCAEKGIPAERCGKVLVATHPAELPGLDALYRSGVALGIEGLELIGPERLAELEPHCVGLRALWSPNTGITNYGQIARALAADIAALGGEVLVRHGIIGIAVRGDGVVLQTPDGEVGARHVITCAGIQSDTLARLTGAPREPHMLPFRGNYWTLRPERRHLARNLIYPVPNPALPFGDVHFIRRVDGSVLLGPNAVLAFARDGYDRFHVNGRDLLATVSAPGFRKLAARHWRLGFWEMARDLSKPMFVRSLQRFVPELRGDDLLPGPTGVAAFAVERDGRPASDFRFDVQGPHFIHARTAPTATFGLVLGCVLADEAVEAFGLTAGAAPVATVGSVVGDRRSSA
jgi:L-2-hydroxyglutarate oxidase LhgO